MGRSVAGSCGAVVAVAFGWREGDAVISLTHIHPAAAIEVTGDGQILLRTPRSKHTDINYSFVR
jgi:hypothetical protein